MSAPTTPEHVARDPPSTPPRLPREMPAFLNPDVKFFGLISGEPIIAVGDDLTIAGVKCYLAAKSNMLPQCIEFYDMQNNHKQIDQNHSLTASVAVFFDAEAAQALRAESWPFAEEHPEEGLQGRPSVMDLLRGSR